MTTSEEITSSKESKTRHFLYKLGRFMEAGGFSLIFGNRPPLTSQERKLIRKNNVSIATESLARDDKKIGHLVFQVLATSDDPAVRETAAMMIDPLFGPGEEVQSNPAVQALLNDSDETVRQTADIMADYVATRVAPKYERLVELRQIIIRE
jgi:hypothetical protein